MTTFIRPAVSKVTTGRVLSPQRLGPEAKLILAEPNAGGDSVRSEAYAMEILYRCCGARGVTTEMAIQYHNEHWKKCDFLTTIGSDRVGVSVTRALVPLRRQRGQSIVTGSRLDPDQLDLELSYLIQKKLYGLVVSRAGVIPRQSFHRTILFVWSPDRVTSRVFEKLFVKTGLVQPNLTDGIELVIAEADQASLRSDFRQLPREDIVVFSGLAEGELE